MGKTCDVCGKQLEAARADARFCSGRCRTLDYRRRHNLVAVTPRRRPPLRDGFRGASLDLDRIVRRWERLVADDRFPRLRPEMAGYRNDLLRAQAALDAMLERWPE